ncbi:MAG: ABC transporter ATP-binding protein [Candidatus Kapaibacterium sp.]
MKSLLLLRPYISRYSTLIVLGLVFVTISNACSAYYPRVIGATVDLMRQGSFEYSRVLTNIGYVLLLTAGSGLFMFLTRKTIIVASRKVEYDLRRDFLQGIERQDPLYFARTPTGSLMAHATNDIAAVREFMGPAIMYGANTVTTFSFALALMFGLSTDITLVALIPLPFMAVATFILGKRVHVAYKQVQEQFEHVTTESQEVFSGIRIIRAFVRELQERSIFYKQSHEYLVRTMTLARIQSVMMPSMMVLVGTSQILVLSYGGNAVIEGRASIGDLTQFFIYLNQLIWPVAAIGWVTNIVQRASASTSRIMTIMKRTPELDNTGSFDAPAKFDIEFRDVAYRYADTLPPVLSDISCTIPYRSHIGIVGTVGSGKSTLVKLVPRLFDCTEGKVLIAGKAIREYKLDDVRKAVGVVMQEPFLFSMSVRDNIKMGKTDATEDEVIEAAKAAQLHAEVLSFTNGYDTVVGERGISLSGGQKQRLAIARALIRKPSVLILDDALSAVDTATEREILHSLSEMRNFQTTLTVAHRLSAVMACDHILVLDGGRIVEQGTHEQLLQLGGQYASLYEQQQLEAEIQQDDASGS